MPPDLEASSFGPPPQARRREDQAAARKFLMAGIGLAVFAVLGLLTLLVLNPSLFARVTAVLGAAVVGGLGPWFD